MRTVKKLATLLLCTVMYITMTAGIAALLTDSTLDDSSALTAGIIDSEYLGMICESVQASLEREMALVAITPEDISHIVTEELIREEAPSAAMGLMGRIFGTDDREWSFESEELHRYIETYLTAYAEENGIEYEEGSADQVYEMICDTVTAELNVIPASYVDALAPTVAKLRRICGMWWIPVTVYAICTVSVLILGRHRIKNAVYNVSLPSYFAAFTVFAASAILYSKDYLAKTVLGDGTLQHLLRQICNAILLNIRQASLALTVIFLIIGAVAVIALALSGKKKRRHRAE